MPQPASALSPRSDPINSKTASVVHPREWMPCPSCPLWSRAPKTRHFTSYKQATDHELRTIEARRLVERFEWHYTPKHGRWLDLAESELGVLTSQCFDRRIPDKQTPVEEIAALEQDRNCNHTKANWEFTTPNARIKLKHLYPSI